MRYDRDELLARTDLAALADQLLGGHVGHGQAARWPSPVPDHPQTGRTPPMSMFTDHRGIERWTCFATGASGTAIDLVCIATARGIGESMEWLAERSHLEPGTEREVFRPPRSAPQPQPMRGPSSALRSYVSSCERILWTPAADELRDWLVYERCLDPAVLRRNRIGADPGPRELARPPGLPRQGLAAVFPVLDGSALPIYLQARYLRPPAGRGKYDNPTAAHGSNPRLAPIEPASDPAGAATIITEGVPDALAVAGAGLRAVAILGSGVPDQRVARRLAERQGPLVLAFDSDPAGRTGSGRLSEFLAEHGRQDAIELEPPAHDLNAWLVARGPADFKRQLRMGIRLRSAGVRGDARGRSIA